MIHIINSHSTNNAKAGANYLLADKDHNGTQRAIKPVPMFGRGNVQTVAKIANSLEQKHKYTSGTLSFRDNERPTEQQQQEIIDKFERHFFAGMVDRVAIAWIRHEDKGNIELNYLMARHDLKSGKAFNAFPPGKLTNDYNDAFVKKINHDMGYDQITPKRGKEAPDEDKTFLKSGKFSTQKEATGTVLKSVEESIRDGKINSRNDLLEHLKEFGEITRKGGDYVSLKPNGLEKAIRFKGAIFDQSANFQQIKEDIKNNGLSQDLPKKLTPEEYRQNDSNIERMKQSKIAYIDKTYNKNSPSNSADNSTSSTSTTDNKNKGEKFKRDIKKTEDEAWQLGFKIAEMVKNGEQKHKIEEVKHQKQQKENETKGIKQEQKNHKEKTKQQDTAPQQTQQQQSSNTSSTNSQGNSQNNNDSGTEQAPTTSSSPSGGSGLAGALASANSADGRLSMLESSRSKPPTIAEIQAIIAARAAAKAAWENYHKLQVEEYAKEIGLSRPRPRL